jgi:hypothetical protein
MSMESEFFASARKIVVPPQLVQPIPAELLGNEQEPPSPSTEQVQAADKLFAQEAKETDAGAIVGMWSAGMLLNELVQDAIARIEEEQDDEKTTDDPENLDKS